MLADRADEIIGHVLAHILIATNSAAPDRLTLGSLPDRLRLRFNIILIIFISAGRHIR